MPHYAPFRSFKRTHSSGLSHKRRNLALPTQSRFLSTASTSNLKWSFARINRAMVRPTLHVLSAGVIGRVK